MVKVECLCPPKPDGSVRHPDGDTIELHERMDFRSVLAARNAMGLVYDDDPDASVAEVLAALTETYILLGVRSWTLVDAKNKPIPVTKPAIREYLLVNDEAAIAVSDEADELYRDRIIAPLVVAAQKSSPPSPTERSTSATKASSPKPRKPSRPSSTSTTRTDGIEMTSPLLAGGSRSSPSSA